uniref:D-3-phosphoglycerate dehydrogenase n=1 Tax=Dendroctonus ponderosae TaxID=77166 RepID=A0AAR5PAF3_DENPD
MDIRNVLVADAVDEACVALLQRHSIQVDCKYKLSKEQLIQAIQNYDAIVVRSDTKVGAEVIQAGSRLKAIGRAGAGVDNIDVNAATARDVVVLNTPGGNAISACELTCALIANLARNVAAASASLKAGRWDRKLYAGRELSGKTLAIIGLGRIGKEVALRMQAWGMTTIGFDPIVTPQEAQQFNVQYLELDALWRRADYITVHTPLIPATRNLINAQVLGSCKKGVKVINVARGGIVNEGDLLAALKSGQCGGAAIDVYEQEPPTNPVTLELIAHDKVVATPHLGASTAEAQVRVAVEVAEQLIALTGRSPEYKSTSGVINRAVLEKLTTA